MAQAIKIYNPRDIPFGPLSNNSEQSMNIDGKRWKTVTNYILSNMVLGPVNRLTLQNSKIKGTSKQANVESIVRNTVAHAEVKQKRKLSAGEIAAIERTVISDVHGSKMDIYQKYNNMLGEEHFNATKKAVEEAYNAKIKADPNLQRALIQTGNVPIC